MQEHIVWVLLYRGLIYGAIPVLFMLFSGLFVLRRHRRLLPVVALLAGYQAACFWGLRGTPPAIPQRSQLQILAMALPLGVAVLGAFWAWRAAESARERWIGVAIAAVGSALTAAQVAFYIRILWQSI